jgi:hypothetical protein
VDSSNLHAALPRQIEMVPQIRTSMLKPPQSISTQANSLRSSLLLP